MAQYKVVDGQLKEIEEMKKKYNYNCQPTYIKRS